MAKTCFLPDGAQMHTILHFGKVWYFDSKKFMQSYHVNLLLIHLDPGAKKECEQQLVFFKQRSTHITVQTEGEVVVNILHTLWKILWQKKFGYEYTVKPVLLIRILISHFILTTVRDREHQRC